MSVTPYTLDESVYYAGIQFYARGHQWRHVQTQAKLGLKKLGNEPTMHFWAAAGVLMEDRAAEALRELQKISEESDVNLPVALAMLHAHKASTLVDKEAVKELEGKVKELAKSCSDTALLHGAQFLLYTDKLDKARDLLDRLLKNHPDSEQGNALRGWIDLLSGREAYVKKSVKYFDDALKNYEGQHKTNIDALFGKVQYLQLHKNDHARSLDLINQAVVYFPNFLPALIERMKIQLATEDWDGAVESAMQCREVDPNCLDAILTDILYVLVRSGRVSDAATKVADLVAALDQTEPRSHKLYYQYSVVCTRLSSRSEAVLQQTQTLLERAMTLSPDNATYHTELGNHQLMAGAVKDAVKSFKKAMSLDETSVAALNGVILCQLLEGQVEEAQQQIEFLNEIQSSIGKSAELNYLSAFLENLKNSPSERVMQLLDDAVATHAKATEGIPYSAEYFRLLAPDFTVQLAKLYLQYAPNDPPEKGDAAPPMLAKVGRILEALTKVAPGQIDASYLLARTKFLSGQTEAAQSGAQYCLKCDATHTDAHLLMAQINLVNNSPKAAAQSLEVALSYNFEVREAPMYHVIEARVHTSQNKLEDALKSLQNAMKINGVKKSATKVPGKTKAKRVITIADRTTVYLEMTKLLYKLNQSHEASRLMQDAINEFSGTTEEVRVAVANADLAESRGDVEGALNILRSIKTDSSYYVQAKEKMAEIYLTQHKDKRLYAACYKELVDQNPSAHAYILLGDAYLRIQEPDKAIGVYETALKKNPKDSVLASKIGSALVKTHDYTKAINYYEHAVKSGDMPRLREDLASLYIKLKQFEKAEKVLESALDHADSTELDTVMADVRCHMLTAKMHTDAMRPKMAIVSLTKAHDAQSSVISRFASEQPEGLKQQQHLQAEICLKMARHYENEDKDLARATQLYQEALRHEESNAQASLSLAHLHLSKGELDDAEFQLTQLLRHDKHNNDATVLMADVMFSKHNYDAATVHFQQLLEREPTHYEALSKLIYLLRRVGKLVDASKYIDQAQAASPRAATEPGLNYCKGLHKLFTTQPNEALKFMNLARKDSEWGVKALYQMIEISLNPDNQTVGGETFTSTTTSPEASAVGLQTAENLLGELKQAVHLRADAAWVLKYELQRGYAMLASKNKGAMENALKHFLDLTTAHPDSVAVMLATARAYMLLKNTPKARNTLKRVTTMEWTSEDADDFEGCWLLLTDIYVTAGKFDLAQELLKKILNHNKSCSKGWEYMGYIMEKEQSYESASEFYVNAWTFCNETDPVIGFKLAFNYLKAKKYVQAVDICHTVLKHNPEYPKIRKEILEKARAGLRL